MEAKTTNQQLVKFIVAGVLFFFWNTIQGAIQAQGPIHEFLELGPAHIIVGAHVHVGLVGWVSLLLAALIYYLVPVLTSKPIAAPRLINLIFWIWVIAAPIMYILMIIVGIVSGKAFAAGTVGEELEAIMGPYMMPISILGIICAIVALIFVVQILVTIARKVR